VDLKGLIHHRQHTRLEFCTKPNFSTTQKFEGLACDVPCLKTKTYFVTSGHEVVSKLSDEKWEVVKNSETQALFAEIWA
jgi:hypothetical protein